MKIIIVGCGKVGTTLAEQLNRENHDITLIDCDSEALQSISDSTDVMSVTGNGAVYQVQMEAGIKEADLLIATTNSDELNMLCCLIAKKAGNCHTIARIRNPEYSAEINYLWPSILSWQRPGRLPGCFVSPTPSRLSCLPRAGLSFLNS